MSKGKSRHLPCLVCYLYFCLSPSPSKTHTHTHIPNQQASAQFKMRLLQHFQLITTTKQLSQWGGWQGNYYSCQSIFYLSILT